MVANDATPAEKVDILGRQGSKKKYHAEVLGFNSRLDSLQAAILGVKLKYLDGWKPRHLRIRKAQGSIAMTSNPSRLKVLFVPAWYPSEKSPVSGIFVREQAKAVTLYDDVVVLYSSSSSKPIKKFYVISEALEDRVRTVRVRYRHLLVGKIDYIVYIYSVLKAYQYLAQCGFKPDIIHAHVFWAGVPAAILGKRFHIPVVITEHSTNVLKKDLNALRAILLKFAMSRAKLVLPVSRSLERSIREYVRAQTRVVPNCVNTNLYSLVKNNASQGKKRILFVGLLVPRKGVPYLLKALSLLKQRRNDFILDIIGDGPGREEYENLASNLGLHRFVAFHGFLDRTRKIELLKRSDYLVLPSSWENFGVVLIEAMACGKPVIATARGGPREIVTKDVGILVPPEDPLALADAINYMLDHHSSYSPETLAEYAREHYSYEVVGKRLHEVYAKLIHQVAEDAA